MRKTKSNDIVSVENWRESQAAVDELKKRANEGDVSVLPHLRAFFDAHPDEWKLIDLAKAQVNFMVKPLGQLTVTEALHRQYEDLTARLTADNPTPLEALLIQRIGITWLHVSIAQMQYSNQAGGNFKSDAFYHKRLERAQRMHLDAIKALAAVRKLQLPAMQINIGEKQINNMGTSPQHLG